ncbi:MAG: pyridoxamine 5'-phosphate oxidase family protein [Anaerolineales bacterium]
METYHIRRAEKAITERAELLEIIREQKYVTLALCSGEQPYLVSVNYGYDVAENCFYFHCAKEGRKIDYLEANPVVYGQILEDNGYVAGECDHAARTVQFRARATFLESAEAKRRALALMIDQLEPDPEPVKARTLKAPRIAGVTVVSLQVETLTGKRLGVAAS